MSEKKRGWIGKIILTLSYFALMVLATEIRTHLLVSFLRRLALGTAAILLIPGKYAVLSLEPKPNRWQITVIGLCSSGLFFTFREHWLAFYKFESFAAQLGSLWPVLLSAVSLAGIVCSLPIQWKLVSLGQVFLENLSAASDTQAQTLGRVSVKWILRGMVLLSVLFQFYVMQYSLLPFPSFLFDLDGKYLLLNLAVILSVCLILLFLLQRWRYALLGSYIIFYSWAVANHFVYKLHGSPLFVGELANAATAFDVLGNYSLSLADIPWFVLSVGLYGLVFFRTFWVLDKKYDALSWQRIAARVGLFALLVWPIYSQLFSKDAKVINGFHVSYFSSRYGFVCVAAADAAKTMDPIIIPEGYSADALPQAAAVSASPAQDRPDVILILNETFCDLGEYTSLDADRDYMAPFYSVDNAFFGHAVVPSVGGGTNNSEFELLTGFPFYLAGANAPFNYLNFTKVNSNAVQYFKHLGYYSVAMHFYSRDNYRRNTAYPAMGFDDSVLGPPEALDLEKYGKRGHLDRHYYRMMEAIYEECPDQQPRFMYLLTFQNHGGYTQNDASLDTVHARVNFGTVDDQVDEFLTSLSMSAEAFTELTDYYAAAERKVIICMVGDHAPSFIREIQSNKNRRSDQESIAQRTVPYVLWSNYELDLSGCSEIINVFGLVPQLAEAAGLPMPEYYRSVREMEREYPVLLSNGTVLTKKGKTADYNASDPRYASVKKCLFIAYNSLNHGSDFIEALYLPQ